jgi:hypothetical protein
LLITGNENAIFAKKFNNGLRKIFESSDNLDLSQNLEKIDSFEDEVTSALYETLKNHDMKKEIDEVK